MFFSDFRDIGTPQQNGSFSFIKGALPFDDTNSFGLCEDEHGPPKRLRVSDIDISRYDEEFIEIQEIASGHFGKVKVARHRLDGMLYAIKVSL